MRLFSRLLSLLVALTVLTAQPFSASATTYTNSFSTTGSISSSSASALLLLVNSTTDVLFHNLFERCSFIASVDSAGGALLTNAIASASGLVKGTIDLKDCSSFHCTDLCAGVTDQVYHSGTVASSESGIAIVAS